MLTKSLAEGLWVRVLLRHSVVVASPKRIVINHTQLSLFVLELPFPNRKAEVIFHYSFWNFRSQIEKRKSHFTVRFGTSVPKSKSGSHISLFVLELSLPNRKEKADLPQFALEQIEKPRTFRFSNLPSKSKRGR